MVERQLTPVMVVDLDGTLVRGNTLHIALRLGLRRGSLLSRLAIASWLVARRLRLVSHERMKYAALPRVFAARGVADEFKALVTSSLNSDVVDLISRHEAAGGLVLLATAAAASYVPLIWNGDYVASPAGGPDLRGDAKVRAVDEWVKAHGGRVSMFLTDHQHDLPMARYAAAAGARVVLVNPRPAALEAFSAEGFTQVLTTPATASLSHQEHP